MPDSRDKLTIFLITGSSSSKQKDRIDDGRGSKVHDFAHEDLMFGKYEILQTIRELENMSLQAF